ncbi:unnamed protein product [Bursaphelenchus okinawaensis]|uniref:Protein kinase domain-containing protein n=1 Tax=Bursaphelenchus okinawaensis TaxID=465554 RepID=A0A811K143_9BILA|nr:unnamed protein product [Bursaphelenchus okinawaensis]CAG9089493.1 unnamed protein product [Bursaphelenchus okinawaensis]
MTSNVYFNEGDVINNRFTVIQMLGEGGFGAVYKVITSDNQTFAMKSETHNPDGVLKMEVLILKLVNAKGYAHFCRCIDAGKTSTATLYMVMTLLGPNLSELRSDLPDQKFSMGCSLSVGKQCVEAIQEIHSVGFLHRDLKPSNFAIGPETNSRRILMFDFGLARRYRNSDGTVRPPRVAPGFRGTIRYAPLSCHVYREQSRKCDLETWFYQQVELTRGALPWRCSDDRNRVGVFKEKCRYGLGLKEFLSGCPAEYVEILRYLDRLRYFDTPKYKLILDLMDQALESLNLSEYPYDWESTSKLYQKFMAKKEADRLAEKQAKGPRPTLTATNNVIYTASNSKDS